MWGLDAPTPASMLRNICFRGRLTSHHQKFWFVSQDTALCASVIALTLERPMDVGFGIFDKDKLSK